MTGKQSVPRAFALILLLVVPLAATSVHADAVRPTAGGWVPMGPPVAWPGLRGVGVYGWDQYCEVAYAKIDHLPSPYSPGRGYGCTHWSSRVGSAHYLPAHGLAVLVSDPRWPLEVTTVSADDPTRTYVNKLHGVPLLASASDDANVYLVIDWEGGRVERYDPTTGELEMIGIAPLGGRVGSAAVWVPASAFPTASLHCTEGCILFFGGAQYCGPLIEPSPTEPWSAACPSNDMIVAFDVATGIGWLESLLPVGLAWSAAAFDPTPRAGCPVGCVYLFGGHLGGMRADPLATTLHGVASRAIYQYDPLSRATTLMTDALPGGTARWHAAWSADEAAFYLVPGRCEWSYAYVLGAYTPLCSDLHRVDQSKTRLPNGGAPYRYVPDPLRGAGLEDPGVFTGQSTVGDCPATLVLSPWPDAPFDVWSARIRGGACGDSEGWLEGRPGEGFRSVSCGPDCPETGIFATCWPYYFTPLGARTIMSCFDGRGAPQEVGSFSFTLLGGGS